MSPTTYPSPQETSSPKASSPAHLPSRHHHFKTTISILLILSITLHILHLVGFPSSQHSHMMSHTPPAYTHTDIQVLPDRGSDEEVPETPPSSQKPPTNSVFPIPESKHDDYCEDEIMKHTRAAQLLLGVRVPSNTTRANVTSLRAFCRFVTSMPGFIDKYFKTEPHLRSYYLFDKERRASWEQAETRKVAFPNDSYGFLPDGYDDWNEGQLKTASFYLIEFAVNYKTKNTESEVKPSTMKGYILGLQRSFKSQWGYSLKLLEGKVFNCPKEGLMSVIDNRFSLHQSHEIFTESHNVLSHDDLSKLYNSISLSRTTPFGFQARLIFDLALITAMRPTALVTLKLDQFSKTKLPGEDVWKIRSVVGSRIGASKTNVCGWKAVREKPTEIIVWNRDCLEGKLNIFQDIDEYIHVRSAIECDSSRFFLGANGKGKVFAEFFRRQHLGKNNFSRIVRDICAEQGITGNGVKEGMTTHGLRGTVTTLLLEAGHADSTVAMRTGHRDMHSLKHYQNLDGKMGMKQQSAIFNSGDDTDKRILGQLQINGSGIEGKKRKVGGNVAAEARGDGGGAVDSAQCLGGEQGAVILPLKTKVK